MSPYSITENTDAARTTLKTFTQRMREVRMLLHRTCVAASIFSVQPAMRGRPGCDQQEITAGLGRPRLQRSLLAGQ